VAELTRGKLSDRPWGYTVGALGLRGLTGQLWLLADGKQYCIAFSGGAIVGAFSPTTSDSAVRVALTSHLVSSTQVAEITRRIAADPERDEIDVIAEAARLGAEQVYKLRRRVVAQRAARTFAIEVGEFVVEDTVTLPVVEGGDLDVRTVIYLGAKTNLGEQRLDAELAQIGVWFKLKPEAVADLPQFGFADAEKPVLRRLVEGANLADLIGDPEIDARLARTVIYAVASCSACEISATPGPSARPATRPPPQRSPSTITAGELRRGNPTIDALNQARTRTTDARQIPTTNPPLARTLTPIPSQTMPPQPRTTTGGQAPPVARTMTNPTAPPVARTMTNPTAPPVARTMTPVPSRTTTPVTTPPAPRTTTPGATMPPPARTVTPSEPPPPPSRTATPTTPQPRNRTSSPSLGGDGVVRMKSPTTTTGPHRALRGSDPPATERPRTASSAIDDTEKLISELVPLLDSDADHFAILGVPFDAPVGTVRSAYFNLARKLHPDRLASLGIDDPARNAQRLFAQINTAFSVLADPERREQYVQKAKRGAVGRAEDAKAEEMAQRVMRAEEAFRRGEMAMRREQIDMAIAEFGAAAALRPQESEYQALLAWAKFTHAPDKQAVATETRTALQKAADASENSPTARFYLGRVERMLGREKEALVHFQEVLRLKPGHTEASSEVRILEQRLRGRR